MAGICDTFICGEDLASIGLKHSTVMNPAVCHDEVLNQQFATCSGSLHDDDHLTSISEVYTMLHVCVLPKEVRGLYWQCL